ncbi:MAG: hypothetical protein HOH19_10595 [Kordiimonadaceae bacterium]|jgi:hypothetical protein|nr:hypothetical protein [Kordiimonadaceae bacterium]MBT6033015.1 hypothetical protein [Kordiimonadaceae bacterium]
MNKDQNDMITRAEEAVEKAAIEFTANLIQRVSNLEKSIHNNDRENVIKMAYELETEAATFGWPRVTRLSKWLRKVFSGDFDRKPEAELVLSTLNALKLMVSDPENQNEERDLQLFKELYPDLSKVISDI